MKYLPHCLDAIRNQDFAGSWEIIVVNNYSTDNSVEWLREQPDVKILDFGKNLGFSTANNKGIFQSSGEFVLCLNFDCFLAPEFLKEVYSAFHKEPDIGMISGKLFKLVNFKQTLWLDTTGIGFDRCFPRDRGEWEIDKGQYDTQQEIFGPSGAAAAYRRSALEEVKFNESEYFDEEMFIYVEDIDLAWRLNLAEWKGRYLPRAIGYHQRGSTREKNSKEKINYFVGGFANRLYTMLKNLRMNEEIRPFWRKIVVQEIIFCFSWGRTSLQNYMIYFLAILRFLKLSALPKTWKKRSFVQKNAGRSPLSLCFDSENPNIDGDTHPFDYNIINNIYIWDYDEIYTVLNDDITSTNINRLQPRDEGLIEGVSSTDDPQIKIKIPKDVADNLPSIFLSVKISMNEDQTGQLIYFDYFGNHVISDHFLLKKGDHEYFLCINTMPLLPHATSFLWENGCDLIRFDPALRSRVHFKIDFIKFFLKRNM